jgi:NAD(P)-dependent dehydrogenase (short-subunit alcohol dehydrogenase family)
MKLMARIAVVSGGPRGIGAAISKALQAASHTVAANYAGNDEAAAKFKVETRIAVYKWDVSNYKACAEEEPGRRACGFCEEISLQRKRAIAAHFRPMD